MPEFDRFGKNRENSNENNKNLQRDTEVNVWCSNLPGWDSINVTPLTGPCKGGTEISGNFAAHVGIPNEVLFASNWINNKDPQTCNHEKGTIDYGWTSPSTFKNLCQDKTYQVQMLLEYREAGRNRTIKHCKLPMFEFEEAPSMVWAWILIGVFAGIFIAIGIVVSCLLYRKKIADQEKVINTNNDVVTKLIGDKEHLVSKDRIKNIVRKSVGSGNYGTVYRSGNLACKVLKRDGDFLGEVGVNPKLDHKNIVKYIGLYVPEQGETDEIFGRFIIVTEFMNNGGLDDFLKNASNRVQKKDMLKFSKDAAEGLFYLNTQNVVHRDIAARNCMLDRRMNLKLTDFGLARPLNSEGVYDISNLGTALPFPWLAIESLHGNKFTIETDVWMLGILIWEIHTRCSLIPYMYMNLMTIPAITQFLKNDRRLSKPEAMSSSTFANLVGLWHKNPKLRHKITKVIEWLDDLSSDESWLNTEGGKVIEYGNVKLCNKLTVVEYGDETKDENGDENVLSDLIYKVLLKKSSEGGLKVSEIDIGETTFGVEIDLVTSGSRTRQEAELIAEFEMYGNFEDEGVYAKPSGTSRPKIV